MSPSDDFVSLRKKQEEEMLSRMTSQLSDVDRQDIHRKALELAALQDKKEDLSCLPKINLEDIKKDVSKSEKIRNETIGTLTQLLLCRRSVTPEKITI